MLAERRQARELMDDPALDPATFRTVLSDLSRVNRTTLAYRPTLQFLDQAVGQRAHFALLDVGYGHGDMLRAIARWAAQRGVDCHLTGIDLDPRSEPAARAATDPALPIHYLTGDYADLRGQHFDCIVSSLVAHHMTGDELRAFLRFMEAEATQGWFVNDLHRHTFSYLGYPILARLMGWHPIVRQDGQTSIARSFRRGEWESLLYQASIVDAVVHRAFPYRLCVTRLR